MTRSMYAAAGGALLLTALTGMASDPIPEMVRVPAGSFAMGADDLAAAGPVHKVKLTDDFFMGRFEISNAQFAEALNYAMAKGYLDPAGLADTSKKKEARGVSKKPQKYLDVSDEDVQIEYKGGTFTARSGHEAEPVVELTWYGAAFYCNMRSEKEGLTPLYNLDDWSCTVYGKEGYRLPTEAEWEYAARYKDARAYPWGDEAPDATRGNLLGAKPGPVAGGSFSPAGDNSLGIADLAGNVAEWCNDWYNDYPGADTVENPVGPDASLFVYLPFFKKFEPVRVVRGGCYLHDPAFRKGMGVPFEVAFVTDRNAVRAAARHYDYRNMSRAMTGFRVVRTTVSKKTRPVATPPESF